MEIGPHCLDGAGTHVLVWAIQDDPKLKREARTLLDTATAQGRVLIPAISLWEIAMLVEKGRIVLGIDVSRWIEQVTALPGIEIAPLTGPISVESVRLPGTFHADPADRMIVATARHHALPLMTADKAILAYSAAGHIDTIPALR
ncbi:PIN domain nuclease, a component of toxin-antitoxin system (PIN domain) [Rhizobium sp. 9140]|nr:PIN domain nuclease, a component of toxin-antitoxin system (PIN domain) [Rhizobium sp. 9140]